MKKLQYLVIGVLITLAAVWFSAFSKNGNGNLESSSRVQGELEARIESKNQFEYDSPSIPEIFEKEFFLSSRNQYASISSIDELQASLEEIRNKHGSGEAALKKITDLFAGSDLPLEILARFIDDLTSAKENLYARTGLILRFSKIDDGELASQLDLTSLLGTVSGKKVLEKGLSAFVGAAPFNSKPDRMEEALSVLFNYSEAQLDEKISVYAASVAKHNLSVEFLSIITEKSPELLQNSQFLSLVSSKWKGEESFIALSGVSSMEDVGVELQFKLAVNAFRYDPVRAKNIYEEVKKDGNEAEWFSAASANIGLHQGELDEARFFLNNSNNEELKVIVEKKLWQKQKDLVVNEVKNDPQGITERLANGSSRYDTYFLEAAVTQWIKQDSEKAAEWVENQGSNLSQDTLQYVAAAYAREAASQGDLDLARHWAGLIQNGNILSRINSNIEEASTAHNN